jgi:hypothetical protein
MAALLSLGNEKMLEGLHAEKLMAECINLSTYLNNIKKDELQKEEQELEDENYDGSMDDPDVLEDGLYAEYNPEDEAKLYADGDYNPDDFADDVFDDDYSVENIVRS